MPENRQDVIHEKVIGDSLEIPIGVPKRCARAPQGILVVPDTHHRLDALVDIENHIRRRVVRHDPDVLPTVRSEIVDSALLSYLGNLKS